MAPAGEHRGCAAFAQRCGGRPAVHPAEVVGEIAQTPFATSGYRETGVCVVEDARKGLSLAAQRIEVVHDADTDMEKQAGHAARPVL